MQFEYFEKESIIYDRMQLPRVVFLKPESMTDSTYGVSKEDLENFSNQEHVMFIEHLQKSLETYEKAIREFYADEFMSDFDFFNLLIKAFPFFGYDTLESYLEALKAMDNDHFKKRLLQSLVSADKEASSIDEEAIVNETEMLLSSRGEEIAYIRNLSTEERYRFNLLVMLEDPKSHLECFTQLMGTLKPIYDKAYESRFDDIKSCEKLLAGMLEKKGEKGFDELTQGFVSKDLLNAEMNRYLVSIVFPYSFMLVSDSKGAFIVSGIHMKEGFEFLLNKYETHVESQTKLFKNFADKTRYEVLRKIASGITSTKQIAQDLGVSSATISYHINAFVTTNILKPSSDKKRRYVVNFEKLEEAYNALINDLKGE